MEFDFSEIQARVELVVQDGDKLLRQAAAITIEDIKVRSLSGASVDEEEFVEYEPRYLRKKEAAGAYRGHPDLYWTGGLYADMRAMEMGDGLEIYFSDAYVDIARGNQNRRNFFGVNETTVEKVHDGLMAEVQRILHGEIS